MRGLGIGAARLVGVTRWSNTIDSHCLCVMRLYAHRTASFAPCALPNPKPTMLTTKEWNRKACRNDPSGALLKGPTLLDMASKPVTPPPNASDVFAGTSSPTTAPPAKKGNPIIVATANAGPLPYTIREARAGRPRPESKT